MPTARRRPTGSGVRRARGGCSRTSSSSLVCIAVWLATGANGDFWPKWVLLFTGIALLGSLVRTALGVEQGDPDERGPT